VKKAFIALARKLAVTMHKILITCKSFEKIIKKERSLANSLRKAVLDLEIQYFGIEQLEMDS